MQYRSEGGGTSLDFEGNTLKVGKKVAAALKGAKDKQVLAGFRPNYVKISGQKSKDSIPGKIYARQLLGGEVLVEAQVKDTMIRARTPADFNLKLEDKCHITLSDSNMNIFNAKTGVAIF
jgi:ABC-type sugar transport system ATPase subunit